MITIYYLLSEAGRAESLLAGRSGAIRQVLTVARGDPLWEEAVQQARVNSSNQLEIDLTGCDGNGAPTYFGYVPTVQDLLSDRAARASRKARREEAE